MEQEIINPETDKALTPVKSTELRLNENYDDMVQVAQLMAKARVSLPDHLHNNPGECLAIVMMSKTWGMNPYAVGSKTSVINKRLMFEGQLVNAVINSSRMLSERLHYSFTGEGENRECTCSGLIRGEKEHREVTVGMPGAGEARNSPLWKGSQHQRDQQLTYKASRVWARRYVPEVLMGVYCPEDEWSDNDTSNADNTQAIQGRVAFLEKSSSVPVPATIDMKLEAENGK